MPYLRWRQQQRCEEKGIDRIQSDSKVQFKLGYAVKGTKKETWGGGSGSGVDFEWWKTAEIGGTEKQRHRLRVIERKEWGRQ